jgi:DUF4097 and DUF4098 domain-containing protein YvlB
MPTFPTPAPILASVEVVAGSVRLIARDRDDTVVEVRPRDPSRASDVRAAEHARIDFRHGKLTVSAGPKILALGRGGAVEIDIELPSQSRLNASSASADVYADGVLTDCRFSTASGDAHLDAVEGNIKADTASGDIEVQSVVGNASISTASGNTTIGQLDGDLKFQAASGGITIGQLRGNARAQTASGSVAVAAAVNGGFVAMTSSGEVEIGIPEGTAARLDLATSSGVVSNTLESSDGPAEGDETLAVRARTASGDIIVCRAAGPAAA